LPGVIFYTAAHGGFSREIPLGGGAAICDRLTAEWTRTRPFEFRLITPAILGRAAPAGSDLVRFSEREYARFSRAFERAATEEILRHDPGSVIVLSNDVSEGPDFERLGRVGFRIFTIYHVDVVAYVASIYFRGLFRPETTARWYRKAGRFLPPITKLIWEKQEASVRWSRGLVVPSPGMKEVLLRCYPACAAENIHVIPWGAEEPGPPVPADSLRREFGVPTDALVVLTLSRISPEKGQDLLFEALADWERRTNFPSRPLWVFVCGGAAYMQGQRYLEKLRGMAARLRRIKVVFPGHVTGERKRAFFSLADLYVFPSRHESYGLTLLEALSAGLPAVCVDSTGARSVMRPEFGALVPAGRLREAISELLGDDLARAKMADAARRFATSQPFREGAAVLANLLK
jgi:glycosyltransferase involved in cell wall biosynthesis